MNNMLQKISIFQGVSLLFLSIVLGDMLIPGGTVIPDHRVDMIQFYEQTLSFVFKTVI